MNKMPSIDFDAIDSQLASQCKNPAQLKLWTKVSRLVCRGNTSQIRRTKPKIDPAHPETGIAAYVWRVLVFLSSPVANHQCMPVTAVFDLPAYDEEGQWRATLARDMANELQELVDIMLNTIPNQQLYGLHRWARALGY